MGIVGADKFGRAWAKRIMKRTNPGRRRPAPVVLALILKLLKTEAIRIIINERGVESLPCQTQVADSVKSNWT